jgi:hypothetical protein
MKLTDEELERIEDEYFDSGGTSKRAFKAGFLACSESEVRTTEQRVWKEALRILESFEYGHLEDIMKAEGNRKGYIK